MHQHARCTRDHHGAYESKEPLPGNDLPTARVACREYGEVGIEREAQQFQRIEPTIAVCRCRSGRERQVGAEGIAFGDDSVAGQEDGAPARSLITAGDHLPLASVGGELLASVPNRPAQESEVEHDEADNQG